ncbi:Aldehyde dehydrogenase family 3 member B1, partial [Fusarium austroafricanum]
MSKSFAAIRSAAIDGRLHNPIYRKDQLKNLHSALADNAVQIQDAIAKDSKHQPAEVKVEYWLALQALAEAHSSINPAKAFEEEYAVANGHDDTSSREPVGIVVIEPSSHAFFYGLIAALAPTLAAGNCVVV